MNSLEILNLFAGIGGNRALWGNKHEITAIESNLKIAKIYQERFPDDIVIEDDAYDYVLRNYNLYDLIWASPPCPTHSFCNHFLHAQGIRRYPDMGLWKLIIFLRYFTKYNGNNIHWVVENVRPYYTPIIKESFVLGRHFFWSDLYIPSQKWKYSTITICNAKKNTRRDNWQYLRELEGYLGIKLKEKIGSELRRRLLRNCVHPEIGRHILEALNKQTNKQTNLEYFIRKSDSLRIRSENNLENLISRNKGEKDR